ncbi:zinc-binding-domain-containing protein [Nemania serpens]|nr:zinc-binding-domain-containing protein [Nemania serpens]
MGNVRLLPSAASRVVQAANGISSVQGAKAQQKRERNAKDGKTAKSQLKVVRGPDPDLSIYPSSVRISDVDVRTYMQNAKAMDIQCTVCKSTFLKTTRAPQLTEHASNKHSKTLADCFPGYEAV